MIRLTLPIPAKPLWPNGRPHHMAKYRATRDARIGAWAKARAAVWERDPENHQPPMWKNAETRAVFYFPDARTRDRDNAAASLKAVWDGIADAGVIENDAGFVHHPPEMRIDRDRPRVEIVIAPEKPDDLAEPLPTNED